MDYGITAAGFIRKPLDVIETELRAKATTLFGENTDLSNESFEGLLVQLMAYALDQEAWQIAEAAYYSLFPDTAIGVSLSRTTGFGGVRRRGAIAAIVEVSLTGDPYAPISGAFQVGTNQSINFQIIEADALDINGEGTFWFRAINPGEDGNVSTGTITLIVTAEPGIYAATNAAAAKGGLDIETDAELLARYKAAYAAAGSSIGGITAALNDNENIETASGIENYSEVTDANGLPPKSFESIITGAYVPSEVAQIIFDKKPAGIRPYGSESFVIVDAQGNSHTMRWSEATDIPLYMIVNLTVNDQWSDDYKVDVRTNIINFIGGTDSQPTVPVVYGGLRAGEDVLNWQIKAVNFGDPLGKYITVPGVVAIEVLVDTVNPPTLEKDISIALREKAIVNSGDITVNTIPE